MQRPTKKPPNKKRHTKPCKFFQTGACPYTPEECDFAHILATQPAMLNSKPCRYFLAGNCVNGIWCRYNHQVFDAGDSSLGSFDANFCHSPIEDIYMPTSPCQTVYISTPMWPVCIPVQHSTDTGPLLFPSAESPTSSDSGDGSTVVSSDDPPTEHTFPSLLDYSPPQSKRSSYSQSPLVSPVIPHSSSTFPSPVYRYDVSESPHGSLSQKVRNYKTKPCKFYKPDLDRLCPLGDQCTFIHDASESRLPPLVNHEEHGLPLKPLSVTEESKKRGFYPISWRVIGGGVLIGNPKSKGADFDDVSDDLDDPQLSDALSVKVDFPKSDEDVFSLSNFKPRPRASSIPSTPSVSHVYAQSLFSAESPGGL